MKAKNLLMAAGAAALILTAGSGAEANSSWHGNGLGVRAHPVHAQKGRPNLASTSQTGQRNASVIRQSGSGNVARTMQRGDDNQAEFVQAGDGNRGRIIQVGDGLTAVHTQEGGERSNIIQVNRGNASVDIVTGQGRRKRAGRP